MCHYTKFPARIQWFWLNCGSVSWFYTMISAIHSPGGGLKGEWYHGAAQWVILRVTTFVQISQCRGTNVSCPEAPEIQVTWPPPRLRRTRKRPDTDLLHIGFSLDSVCVFWCIFCWIFSEILTHYFTKLYKNCTKFYKILHLCNWCLSRTDDLRMSPGYDWRLETTPGMITAQSECTGPPQ